MLDGALLDKFEITRPYAWTSDGTYQIQFGVPTDTPSKWRFIENSVDLSKFDRLSEGVYIQYEDATHALVAPDAIDARGMRITLTCWGLVGLEERNAKVPGLPFFTCRTMFAIRKDLLVWIQASQVSPTFLRDLPGSLENLKNKINQYIVTENKD